MSEWIQYATREKNGWTILRISGRLDRLTMDEARAESEKFLGGAEKFAVELSALEYLSSAGLRVILRLAKKASAEGKSFALCAPSANSRHVLEDASMDIFVRIYETEEDLP